MRDTYFELSFSPKNEHLLDLIFQAGFSAIEEGDTSYLLRSEDDLSDILEALKLLSLGLNIRLDYKIEIKQNKDWIEEYKKGFAPNYIKPFYLHAPWQEDKKDAINIIIEPGLAFGSGAHESTALALELLSTVNEACNACNKTALDIGCGSGILALALSKLGFTTSLCDIDIEAINCAKENFILNSAKYKNIWQGSAVDVRDTYDLVLANLTGDIIKDIETDIKACSKNYLILSGILSKEAKIIEDIFTDFCLISKPSKGEWTAFLYKKNI